MQQQDNHEYPFLYQRRSEERFSRNAETDLVCRLLLEKKKIERAALGFGDRAGGDEEEAALEDGHAAHRFPVEDEAVHAREVEVADDHLDLPVQFPERFLRRRRAARPVALLLEAAAKNLPQ